MNDLAVTILDQNLIRPGSAGAQVLSRVRCLRRPAFALPILVPFYGVQPSILQEPRFGIRFEPGSLHWHEKGR